MQTWINTLTWLHTAFGIGGVGLGVLLAKWQNIVAFLKSDKGQAVEKDVAAIVAPTLDLLAQSGHPLAPDTIKTINTIISTVQGVK